MTEFLLEIFFMKNCLESFLGFCDRLAINLHKAVKFAKTDQCSRSVGRNGGTKGERNINELYSVIYIRGTSFCFVLSDFIIELLENFQI